MDVMPGFLFMKPKNELHTQGRRARHRLLFRDNVQGQSSWDGDKKVRGGVLSRGFIGR